MEGVLLAGASIGAATALGCLLGGLVHTIEQKTYQLICGLAGGIMLCAAIHGLVLPAQAYSGAGLTCVGIALGAVFLRWMNGLAPNLLRAMEAEGNSRQVHGLLFVLAMAIHHVPEGLAAGVSFGTGKAAETAAVCGAIAIQNVPEAMMIFPMMGQAGTSRRAAVLAAAVSGAMELLGLAMGYWAVQLSQALLPVLLAFAAGAMLYVIWETMLPDVYEVGESERGTGGILMGYCAMLLLADAVAHMG